MLKKLVNITPSIFLDKFESLVLSKYSLAKKFITNVDPELLEAIGRKKALKTFRHAVKNVPAYKQFLSNNEIDIKLIKNPSHFDALVPVTNKKNYVKKFSYEERCLNGKFPFRGNIDESSGTTGKPTNWIRSVNEENLLFKSARFEFDYTFNYSDKDYIVLSAWSTGPWATGIKFCSFVERFCLIKNTDADVGKILETLKTFGSKYNYIIAGYPPFLKHLLDEGKKKITWKNYNIDMITGGEGIIPEWRQYISSHLKKDSKIISSYGASDIDVAIGFETPLTLAITKICQKNQKLREKIFGHHEKMPMLFQYNPSMHYITNIPGKNKQEFAVTLLDKSVASPKIKYNLHDEGGAIRFKEMMRTLKEKEPKFLKKIKNNKMVGVSSKEVLKLPFLFVVGRSDGTISLDGANVYPHQIEKCIHKDKKLAASTKSFKIGVTFDRNKNINFNIRILLKNSIKPTKKLQGKYHNVILNNLVKINADFKESYEHDKSIINPKIYLYRHNSPVFKRKGVKDNYIE